MLSDIILTPITSNDYQFAYDILIQRNNIPKIDNGSFILPTYDEHVEFLSKTPYHIFDIVTIRDIKIGTFFIHKDTYEIGLHTLIENRRLLTKRHGKHKHIGLKILLTGIKKHMPEVFTGKCSKHNNQALNMDDGCIADSWIKKNYQCQRIEREDGYVYYECRIKT